MEINVIKERDRTTEKISFSGKTVKELLDFLKVNPEVVIVTRNNEIILPEEKLKNKDKIELLSVVSGG